MKRLLVASLLALMVGEGSAWAQSHQISLGDRTPLAFLLVTPSGNQAKARSSDLIRIASEVFESESDFKLELVDAGVASECRGRLACIVRQVRTDYRRGDYQLANGQVAPFSEHRRYLKKKKIKYSKYLLVISNLAAGSSDYLSLKLLDTNQALRQYHFAVREQPDWERNVEAKISESAVLAEPDRAAVKDLKEARNYLNGAFSRHIQKIFSEAGHFRPYATIELQLQVHNAGVILNGKTVGTTEVGLNRLTNVSPGKHLLRIEHPDYQPYEAHLELKQGGLTQLQPQLIYISNSGYGSLRKGLIWGGIGLGVAGAAVTGYALATQDGGVTTYCPEPQSNCSGSRFTTFGYQPQNAPSFEDNINPDGVLVAPLGYSLALTGATWALGTYLIGDDDDFPWLQTIGGIVLGGAAYGISAALNGSSPHAQ